MSAPLLSRREWLKLSALGVLGGSTSGWFADLAGAAAPSPAQKACILLWMSGGPSQMDTFDPKPGHANAGPVKAIDTKAPGLQFSEYLPKIAAFGDKMAVVRSLTSKEGDHGRATFLMRTGYLPDSGVAHPPLGAMAAHELAGPGLALPGFVSIAPYRFFNLASHTGGFLGPQYAPLILADNMGAPVPNVDEALKLRDLEPADKVATGHEDSRLDILRDLEKEFADSRPDPFQDHQAAYARAVRLMKSPARKAFDLSAEKASVRDAYGRNLFGQGCLLARRLVEQGVPFVEVTLAGDGGFGWDTHQNNFAQVKQLCSILDPAWAQLMSDLKDRGLLGSTLIVWMGEFGRTPQINGSGGRDHYPNAWSVALAGDGITGGQAVGATSKDGTTVEKRPVTVPDLMATICKTIGLDPNKQTIAGGRPIRIVEKGGTPIKEITG